jgi:hypothetical protein
MIFVELKPAPNNKRIKCVGPHLTTFYPCKERSSEVCCVLCDGNYLANYKGCKV